MNLYRLDRVSPQGETLGPVTDLFGPCLIRERKRADALAIQVARDETCFVHITRIRGAGEMKIIGRTNPYSYLKGSVSRG